MDTRPSLQRKDRHYPSNFANHTAISYSGQFVCLTYYLCKLHPVEQVPPGDPAQQNGAIRKEPGLRPGS